MDRFAALILCLPRYLHHSKLEFYCWINLSLSRDITFCSVQAGSGLAVSPRCDYLLRCPGPIHYTHTSKSFNATAPNFAAPSVFCFFSNIEKLELYTNTHLELRFVEQVCPIMLSIYDNKAIVTCPAKVPPAPHFYLETQHSQQPILLHKPRTGGAAGGQIGP